MIQELFTERYRPKTLDQLILPSRIRKSFGNGELHQNFLLFGSPGLGKTSSAKVLAANYPTLYINVSDESSVDVIRDKITNWCSTISLMDGAERYKVVILDECLNQEERVRIGTVNEWAGVALKDMEIGKVYPCPSLNLETGEWEDDTCEIISEREADLFEIEFADGRKIQVTDNHPFIVLTEDGQLIEKTIVDGLKSTDSVVSF